MENYFVCALSPEPDPNACVGFSQPSGDGRSCEMGYHCENGYFAIVSCHYNDSAGSRCKCETLNYATEFLLPPTGYADCEQGLQMCAGRF
jgi:hypothetical protein